MPAGTLLATYAYEVSPRQASAFVGGPVSFTPDLESALNNMFDRSKIVDAPTVNFQVDPATASRPHPVRDPVRAIAFSPGDQSLQVVKLAGRLAAAMDNRSKPALLMVSSHAASGKDARVVIWTFPQQEVFNLATKNGHAKLEMLDAFNRESTFRKAALIEGADTKAGMLSARILDLQSTAAERSVADLWIVKFLHAQMQMSAAEGTRLLARALRSAHSKTATDQAARDEIASAIGTLRTSKQPRWSIRSVASTFLGDVATDALLASVRAEEQSAMFGLDVDQFDDLIQFTRFTLDSGVVVSAPFVEIGADKDVVVEHVQGRKLLRAQGYVTDEKVRQRA